MNHKKKFKIKTPTLSNRMIVVEDDDFIKDVKESFDKIDEIIKEINEDEDKLMEKIYEQM